MKRGGQEIYVGPLGRHSRQLIEYFEVGCNFDSMSFKADTHVCGSIYFFFIVLYWPEH